MNFSTDRTIIPGSMVSQNVQEAGRDSLDGATLRQNAAPVRNAIQSLPGVATNANRSGAGAWGRHFLSYISNTKFYLRNKLYENLSSVLQHVDDQPYQSENNQVQQELQTFVNKVGMGPQLNEGDLYGVLQSIREILIDEGRQQYAREDHWRTNRGFSSRRPMTNPVTATVEHNDNECLSKGIKELKKQQNNNMVRLGKQIRQLLVELGANAAIIGHTIPNA